MATTTASMVATATIDQTEVELYTLTVEQFEAIVRLGIFDEGDSGVELLRGVLVKPTPEGEPHAWICQQLNILLARGLDIDRLSMRAGSPLRLVETNSQPMPDFAVVTAQSYARRHPETAVLAIEVSSSSLRKDMRLKAGIYAEQGFPEYWVFDLRHRIAHVHRNPIDDRYSEVQERESGQLVALDPGIPAVDLDRLFGSLSA